MITQHLIHALEAFRAAVQIIDLKLSKAGLLDEDTKGKIVLLTRQVDVDGYEKGVGDVGLKTRPTEKSHQPIRFERGPVQ